MHLRIGPGQSIGYRDVCFHRPSGPSVFHRHIKHIGHPGHLKEKPNPLYADASRTRRLLKGV